LIKALTSAAVAASLLLAGCGGGSDTADQGASATGLSALSTAAAAHGTDDTARKQPLAAGTFSAELTGQLFALAESSYTAYFPSKQATRTFDSWAYRYYPETGIYLAVIGSGVYVLGGSFGSEVVRLGEITQFVGQQPTGKDRPLTATILGQCPDVTASTSPNFYGCMIGNLTGTQTFNTAKACRLEVTDDGVLTLSSDGKRGSIGPGFGHISFVKNSSFGNFLLSAFGPGTGAARLTIMSNPTISFSEGGSLGADFTPAGSTTASISCTLNVPK
jgi:hypothetical protein